MRRAPGYEASLAAIEAVYRGRFDRFATVAAAIVGDEAGAKDAVQDAFALAVRRRRQFRGEGSLEAWLWRMVVNQARSQRRSARARGDAEARLPAGEPWAAVDDAAEPDGIVPQLIASLPERQRLVVFLRYYADLTYEQIADALAVRPGTVAATLNGAHGALRVLLEETVTG